MSTAERWRKEAGSKFRFSIKAPKSITHERRFSSVEEETENLIKLARALNAFFLLFQTPKSFKYSDSNLKLVSDYLNSLPKEFILGVELRGWSREEVEKLLKNVEVVHVVDPFKESPLRGDPYYLRLHGSPPGRKMYSYKYTKEDLRYLKRVVEGLEGDVYVVFNNIWMCEDALRFKGTIGSP